MTKAAALPLVCGWWVFTAQICPPVWLHFLECLSDIHGAVSRQLLETLERVFHVLTWKYCFLHCIDTFFKILFYFGCFFLIKVKPFSAALIILHFLKKHPKKPPKHCPCPCTCSCFREASCDTLWKREMWYRKISVNILLFSNICKAELLKRWLVQVDYSPLSTAACKTWNFQPAERFWLVLLYITEL